MERFFSKLWCIQIGNHSQEYLAKFGYGLYMKIKKIGMPIGTTILFYGDFFPFTKKGGWGGVCNNSHKDVFFGKKMS